MLVAGGSGLVPLMAMIRHRRLAGSDAAVRLLLSARSADDVLYARELAEPVDGVEVTITYTRRAPEGWTGPARRVDRELLERVGWPPSRAPLIFACGPTPFVEAVAGALVAIGHDPARIRTERFGATGR
jgi:ferredoxin-NADP reductase